MNLTTEALANATDFCGVRSGRDLDKWKETGLTKGRANALCYTPIIEESPVNIECKVVEVKELGSHHMFLAEVAAGLSVFWFVAYSLNIFYGALIRRDMLCRRAQQEEGNNDEEHAAVALRPAAVEHASFKINACPKGQIGKHLVNGHVVSKLVGVVDMDFNRHFTF